MDVNVFGRASLLIPVQPPSVCLNLLHPQTVSTFWPPILLPKEVETISASGSGPIPPLPLPIEAITLVAVVAKLLSERVKTTGRQSIAGSAGLAHLAPLVQQRGCYETLQALSLPRKF